MLTLVLSDIHGNIDALWALEQELARRGESCDQVLVLGDLVDYGPAPLASVDWVRRKAHHTVRGNHDHAFAMRTDCHSAPPFKEIALAMREHLRPHFDPAMLEYLRRLPTRIATPVDGASAVLVHATPHDPLFEWVPPAAPDWKWLEALGQVAETNTLVLLGHTHVPMVRSVGRATVVNPGSLGQPRDGDPRGCYAILRDGRPELRRLEYDVEAAVTRLRRLPLAPWHLEFLIDVLRTGQAPH
jgi:predicted phosphodiesterase